MEPTIDRAIAPSRRQVRQDDYGQYSMMKHKARRLPRSGTFGAMVPKEVMDKVAQKQKAILDGSFVVKVNDGQPRRPTSSRRLRRARAFRVSPDPVLRLEGITKRFGALLPTTTSR